MYGNRKRNVNHLQENEDSYKCPSYYRTDHTSSCYKGLIIQDKKMYFEQKIENLYLH